MSDIIPIDPSTQVIDPSTQVTDPKPKRKRKEGGQPGNLNALRHGFYAQDLGKRTPQTYDQYELRNMMGEIAMLKDYMYNLYALNIDSTDSTTLSETLRGLSLAGMAISRIMIVHDHCKLSSNGNSTLKELLKALDSLT